jgi:hypothetical protein
MTVAVNIECACEYAAHRLAAVVHGRFPVALSLRDDVHGNFDDVNGVG